MVSQLVGSGKVRDVVLAYQDAASGWTLAQLKASVDAWLAAQTRPPDYFLMNIGINDRLSPPSQAAFEADYGYILDAIHAKWPSASVLVEQVWAVGCTTVSDNFATYISNAVTARSSFSFIVGDERVYLKGADNGASEMEADGVHPKNAGSLSGPGYPDGMAAAFSTWILSH